MRSNRLWYAMKNVWYAELYLRTKDSEYINRRIEEFSAYLEEPYTTLYQEINDNSNRSMVKDIVKAAEHFAKMLKARGCEQMALPLMRYVESVPVLRGGLSSEALYSVQTFDESDRCWLNDVKFRYCKKWLDNCNGSLLSIKLA